MVIDLAVVVLPQQGGGPSGVVVVPVAEHQGVQWDRLTPMLRALFQNRGEAPVS